jgi:hypothetical protein
VTYSIIYYSDQVQTDVLALPDTLQARYFEKTPLKELRIARQRMKEFKK